MSDNLLEDNLLEDNLDDNGKWHIVEFSESKTVGAVPDFWLNKDGTEVIYPPWNNNFKVISAINKRKQPQPDWIFFSISKVFWDASAYILY